MWIIMGADDTLVPDPMPPAEPDLIDLARRYVVMVIDSLNTDATKLARRAKINPSTLTRLIRPDSAARSVRRSTLDAISRVSGVALPPELDAASFSVETATPLQPYTFSRDVPIHGLISAPVVASYYWNQTVVDYAPRPPGIARVSRAFALRMPDETMDGWRRVNELVYVDPTRAVAEGDHAFLEIANSNSPDYPSIYKIRRVVRRRPDGMVLATWGLAPDEERLPRTHVLALHRILEWQELLGG